MAGSLTEFAKQWLFGLGASHARETLVRSLPTGVVLGRVTRALNSRGMTVSERKQLGDKLLGIYFRQIFSDVPLFFDLRPSRLGWDGEELTWDATKSFFVLEPTFRRSLQNLYRGYYDNDLALLKTALSELNLVADHEDEVGEKRVVDLLLNRFSGGREGTVRFSMQQFKSSFDSLFNELISGKKRLPPDFAFVGLLLASLYLTLESLDVDLDVSSQYRGAIEAAARRDV